MNMAAKFIEIIVDELEKEAYRLEGSPTFDWVKEQAAKFIAEIPLLSVSDIEIIDQRFRERVQVVVPEIKAALTRRGRENLIDKNALSNLQYYWPRYCHFFDKKGLSKKILEATDEATNRILQLTPRTDQDSFLCKGMVIGDVQAGKTDNYTALINKASDLGYRLVIVLTGITENLRAQTQARLDSDFIGALSDAQGIKGNQEAIGVGLVESDLSKRPGTFTDRAQDFKQTPRFNLHAQKSPVLIVSKKNASILRRIDAWINSQIPAGYSGVDLPVLLIDDEADNASVNTGKEDEDPKTINRLIRQIIQKCSKITYIAYTATPFANIFIDPDSQGDTADSVDLYPSDFIIALEAPPNYCGGRFFFDEDASVFSNHIREVIADASEHIDLSHKSDFAPSTLPPSLYEAIDSFFIAAAIKDIRREKGIIPTRSRFDSMLINMSRFTKVQSEIYFIVVMHVRDISNALSLGDLGENAVLARLERLFYEHYATVANVEETWDDIKRALIKMDRPDVLRVHAMSDTELDYSEASSSKVIAVGGLKLSRGLTLEGLVISYFYRQSMMYDTLMQMARWFGYRDGYKDLLRLWTTADAADWYLHITRATEELKAFLIKMERAKLEPDEFGIRVRSHPESLLVTAKNKMRSGSEHTERVRFDDSLKETFFVDCREAERLRQTEITKSWIKSLDKEPELIRTRQDRIRGYWYKNISGMQIVDFFSNFNPHKGNMWARLSAYKIYLSERSDYELRNWDVVIQSNTAGIAADSIKEDFGLGFEIYAQNRSTTLKRQSAKSESLKHLEAFAYELPLGDNGKVGQGNFELFGLTQDQIDELGTKPTPEEIRKYKADNGLNPLLVIHLVSVTADASSVAKNIEDRTDAYKEAIMAVNPQNPYVALSFSIPPADINFEGVTYVLNRNARRELWGDDEFIEEED